MDVNDIKFNKADLSFLVRLKCHEFKKEADNINNEDIKRYLFDVKWKKRKSLPMCDIIDDVMSLQFSEIFDYLYVQVVKEASNLNINAFEDLISK